MVVEQKTGSWHRDAIAIVEIDRTGGGHQPAAAIRHRHVGGVIALRKQGRPGQQLGRRPMAQRIDRRHQRLDRAIRQPAFPGLGRLGPIAQAGIALPVGQIHRLAHQVQRGGTVRSQRRQIKALQHPQQLQHGDAPSRRRQPQHLVAVKANLQWPHRFGPIGQQIGGADQAAPHTHQPHQGLGAGAPIKAGPAAGRNSPQAGGQLGLPQALPRLQRPPAASPIGSKKQRPGARISQQQRRRRRQRLAEVFTHRHPFSRQGDRRGQHPLQRQAAVAALGQHQARHGARHRSAQQAGGGAAAIHRPATIEKQIGASRGRGALAKINAQGKTAAQGQLLCCSRRAGAGAGRGGGR